MSQLNDILERLAEIQETVTITGGSVGRAYPYIPAAPAASECPFFVNEIGGGPSNLAAVSGLQARTSTITMHLCLSPWQLDVSQEATLEEMCAWADAVYAKFAQKVRLGGDLGYVLEAVITAWDAEKLTLGMTEFGALKFVLTVRELYTQTIAA